MLSHQPVTGHFHTSMLALGVRSSSEFFFNSMRSHAVTWGFVVVTAHRPFRSSTLLSYLLVLMYRYSLLFAWKDNILVLALF